jgi:lysophospholipase L1-like esterase
MRHTAYPLFLAVVLGYSVLCVRGQSPDGSDPVRFKAGERIALVGGGVLEQERTHGYLETLLVSRHPEADLVIRNLAWGGDTVRGDARTSGYQQPDGLARLLKEVHEFKPTVIILGYGMNESFDGQPGLAGFIEDYQQLLVKVAPLKARIVILSPTYHEDLGRPLPDPERHNDDLLKYTAALKKLAAQRGVAFVDVFNPLSCYKQRYPTARLTTNGLLLTATGSAIVAQAVVDDLAMAEYDWDVGIDAGKVLRAHGTKIDQVSINNGVMRFLPADAMLPNPPAADVRPALQQLNVAGLAPGEYVLAIDGQHVAQASATKWQQGVNIASGPAFGDAEKLRAAIVRKNELFYRRWRPFNDHSRHWGFMQGDFALYDKEIADQERIIAEARRPRPHAFVLSPKEAK